MNSLSIRLTVRSIAEDRIETQSADGAVFSLPAEILSTPPSVGDRISISAVLEKVMEDDSCLYKQRLNELLALPVP